MTAKQVLLAIHGAVLYGVVIETIERYQKGGGSKNVYKVLHVDPDTGAELEIERDELEVCEVTGYNTSERDAFVQQHGGGAWATKKAAEFYDPRPRPVPVSTLDDQPL